MTILDLFDAALADRAGHLAVDGATYEDLHAGALRVAGLLEDAGLRPGDRLALYVENRIGFVYAYLAALRLGVVAVPVNVLYRSSDLAHVLDDAGAAAVVTSAGTHAHVAPLPWSPPAIGVDAIEACARDAAQPALAPARVPGPADVAVILYTSGTTGRSKGAMLTHGNLAAIAAQIVVAWRWSAADSLLVALPLFHMHGLGAALNGTLAAGARLTVHERFDAARVLGELRGGEHTMFFGVPTMYVRMLETAGDEPVPPLRLYVSGSAALSPAVHAEFRRRFGAEILERLGATEFGFALTNRYGGPRVAGSVGVPPPGTAVAIVAPGTVDPVAAGDTGELLVSGPTVFAGYWNQPDATHAAFATQADGTRWYRSGDLARYSPEEGVYRIVGRLKELIISGGFNVYPREVELEIERDETVRACAVVGVADAARGELPVAFVEAGAGFDEATLLTRLRGRLASFKVPKAVYVVEALPRNALGKVEKQRLAPPGGA